MGLNPAISTIGNRPQCPCSCGFWQFFRADYLIANLKTMEGYVGRTYQEVGHRWRQHIDGMSKDATSKLAEALRNAPEDFEFMVLERSMTASESHWLDRLKAEGWTLLNETGGNRKPPKQRDTAAERAWREANAAANEMWRRTVDSVACSTFKHVPFELLTCFINDLPDSVWTGCSPPSVDLIYGGSAREGKRIRALHDWYFGLPDDISSEVFGKVALADFAYLGSSATPPEFSTAVPYGQMLPKLATSLAHVAIGDASYAKLMLVPHRVYESLMAGCFTFVDVALDPCRRIYSASEPASFFYVNDQAQLVERLRMLKEEPYIHKQMREYGWWALKRRFELPAFLAKALSR